MISKCYRFFLNLNNKPEFNLIYNSEDLKIFRDIRSLSSTSIQNY